MHFQFMCIVPSDILGKSCLFFFSPQPPLKGTLQRCFLIPICLRNTGNTYFPTDLKNLKDVCFVEIYFRFCDTLWNMCLRLGFLF